MTSEKLKQTANQTKQSRKVYQITPKELSKMSANLSNLTQLFDEGDTTYEDINSNYPDYLELAKGQSMMTKGPPSTNLNVTNSPILSVKRFHSKMSSGGGD